MKKLAVMAAAVAFCLPPVMAQTQINGSRTILGNLDSGAAASSRLVTGNGAPPAAKCNTAKAIASSTNASPIVVTSTAHGFSNGDVVTVYGHAVDTAANGTWVVGSVTANTLALCGYWDGTTCQNPSTGNGVGAATGFLSAQVGRLYFRNDATAGQNLYMCTDATGSPAWVQQLNSGGSGGGVGDPGGNGIMARTALNTIINRVITGTANHISVSNGDGVAGNPALDIPAGVSLPNASMGTGYLSSTKTAGSTGVTANLLAKIDTSGNVVTAAAGDTGILGVALATVSSGGAVEVAVSGIVNCVADNTTVIGDMLIVGTTTAGRCRDATGIAMGTQVIGKALTAVAAGSAVSVQLYGPGQYGPRLAVDSTPNLFVAGGGTAQAQTATFAPAITALVNGLYACWLPAAANTGAAPTFAPNGLTAKPITKLGTTALAANDLSTTALACALYDGTEWQLQNPQTASVFAAIPQTATYQVLAADFALNKTIPVASGTFTITLVASGSQPASGQSIDIINYGSGVVTVARSGQNINGAAANLTIAAGSASAPLGLHIISDGTNYIAQTWGGSSGGGGGSFNQTLQANGTALTQRATMNFVGQCWTGADVGSATSTARLFDFHTMACDVEDFIGANDGTGSIGSHNMFKTGGTVAHTVVVGHPGNLQMDTGATNNTGVYVYSNSGLYSFDFSEMFDVVYIFRLQTTLDAGSQARLSLINSTAGSADPNNSIQIEKLGADSSWFGKTRNGGINDTRTAAIATADNNFHYFEIKRIDSATVGMQIDGAGLQCVTTAGSLPGACSSGVTSATHIPTGGVALEVYIDNLTTGASHKADYDAWSVLITGLTR